MMENRETLSVAVVVLNWNGLSHLQSYLLQSSLIQLRAYRFGLRTMEARTTACHGFTDNSEHVFKSSNFEKTMDLLRVTIVHSLTLILTFFVLLNSDVRIDGKWIEPVIDAMCEYGWDVASPMVVQDENPLWCEHAGAAGGLMDRDGYPFCCGRIFNHCEQVDDWHKQNREVFGLLVRVFSSDVSHGTWLVDSMGAFLHTWKKLIFAGA